MSNQFCLDGGGVTVPAFQKSKIQNRLGIPQQEENFAATWSQVHNLLKNSSSSLIFTMPTNQQFQESIKVNQNLFVPLGKGMVVIGGLLTLIGGLINFFHSSLSSWCVTTTEQTCVGPALKWNSGSTPFLDDSNMSGWRTVITTDVNTVIDVFSPLVFGALVLLTGSTNSRNVSPFIASFAYSWPRMGVLFIFTSFFGSMGYSGNYGIVVGTYNLVVALYLFLIGMIPGISGNSYPCANTNPNHSSTPLFDRVFKKPRFANPANSAAAPKARQGVARNVGYKGTKMTKGEKASTVRGAPGSRL